MIALWSGIALLTLVAVAFVFWPLLRARREADRLAEQADDTSVDRQHLNIEIYRERLAELENERDSGTLDAENFEVLKLELERNLLIDAEEQAPELKHPRPGAAQFTTVVLLALLIPVIAFGLYNTLGRSGDLALALNPPQMPTLEEAVTELEKELQANPDNAEGWYLLATTYVNQGRFDEGVEAFRRVAEILPEDAPQFAGVQGQIAQALYFQAGGSMTPEVQAQIDRTLELDPDDMAALGLLGINAYETGDYRAAIEYWSHAMESAHGEAVQSLRAGIEQAQQQLAAAGEEVPELKAPAKTSISVSVTLSDELKAQVSPDQAVFIYARPVGGRMPLAAVRIQVSDLPLDVVLDDSMAMMPGAELSSVDAVEVGARISASGQAIAQPGDLVGSQSPVATGGDSERVTLVIDQVVE
ncbi:c-type cytochrome biogenesis protein CcmI [Marinobacterium lutimaris]|uniref:Cytochrome c-type biogenesis protein CcmH n=1 Tax=Marinobacterium lutimaris TaxID=568106 RepID=A0A1H6BB26_9GAMM|nr:c-type cytochrome biogenesis protein CcmI [Marinobacterium lutimaris]SEG57840.1 cytochrome c-type biogenesis protein CcmH [Marinobacterium lutimaris]